MKVKKWRLFALTLAGVVCLFLAHPKGSAAQDPIFFADFDGGGADNDDPNNYVAENAGNTWGIGDFPANGTNALQMTGGGCGSSSFTPFPTVENWSNGIIQFDMGWNDDDSWGIMFRREDEETGYLAFFGWIETVHLALFDLGVMGMTNGQCLSQAAGAIEDGVEPGGAIINNFLVTVPHGFEGMTTGPADVSYTGRILADGPKIVVWYGPTEDFPDDPLEEPTGVALKIEFEDDTYEAGSVGIWQESNDNGIIDNLYVFGDNALTPVEPLGKLATAWGKLKVQ